MTTPLKCEIKPTQYDYMRYEDTDPVRTTVYNWVAENSQGEFDMNDPEVPVPSSGVSYRASDGKMHIALYGNLYAVNDGDYVIERRATMSGPTFEALSPENFQAKYRVSSG
mgnify:CR=1 FL=1